MKIPMETVWKARKLILSGIPVKDVASSLKISEKTVRGYCQSEIKKNKEKELIF